MRTARRAGVGLVILAAVGLSGGAARAATPQPLTRNDLAVRMARAAGIALPGTGQGPAAAAALRKRGIDLGSDLSAPVTQELLVRVGRTSGVSVSGSHPQATVSPAIGAAFVNSIQGSLLSAPAARSDDTVNASCKGRESRAGRRGTPASNANPNATAGPCEEPIP